MTMTPLHRGSKCSTLDVPELQALAVSPSMANSEGQEGGGKLHNMTLSQKWHELCNIYLDTIDAN